MTQERIYDLLRGTNHAGASQIIAAEINALTVYLAEARAEARAEVATLTLKLANARLNLKNCSEEVDKRDECAGQLAEARADVERLRPAAEAWEAQEVYDSLTGYEPNLPDIWQKRQAAAARARAAKGEK